LVPGHFDLTAEQILELAEVAAKRLKEAKKLHNAKYYRMQRERNLESYNERHRRYAKTYRQFSSDKKAANQARYIQKVREEKRWYCEFCGVTCTSNYQLNLHNRSRRHKLAVQRAAAGKLRFHCKPCGKHFTHMCHLERHRNGERHREVMASLAAS